MASSLFGRQSNSQQMTNPFQMIQAFSQFKQQMSGKDPQAMVNELISSGKMSK